jgi:hypothetical protein
VVFHFPQRTPSWSTSCTSSLRRPSRGQYAFGSLNDFAPSTHYGQDRSFLQHASPQLARLIRHALNRGNVLEGSLRDRTADGGNPACQGQVSTQVSALDLPATYFDGPFTDFQYKLRATA